MIASGLGCPRMPSRSRRPVAFLLALALAAPAGAPAQAPAAVPGASLAGGWSGWAKLVNDWPGQACRYEGGPDAVSVRMELGVDAGRLRGSVAIDLPAEAGSGCPPLRKRYDIAEAAAGPDTLAFTDSGGNEWTLAVRRGQTVLQGLLAWRPGGAEAPLAEGFTRPDGVRPTARLSGEVRLRRGEQGAAEPAAEPAAPAAEPPAPSAAGGGAPAPAGGGRHLSNLGLIVGANVVGLGILYGVNKAGKGSSESGTVTCSPRVCIVGPTINDPCFCENNVVSGAPCGTTQAGAPIGAPCNGTSVPCQVGLSCNSGICEDRFGRCQF